MTNKEFIQKFCTGNFDEDKVYRCGNLTIQDDRLFSYSTCIAEFKYNPHIVYINMTKYSPTTSRHQNLMRKYFEIYRSEFCWELLTNVPINTKNLSRYDYGKM